MVGVLFAGVLSIGVLSIGFFSTSAISGWRFVHWSFVRNYNKRLVLSVRVLSIGVLSVGILSWGMTVVSSWWCSEVSGKSGLLCDMRDVVGQEVVGLLDGNLIGDYFIEQSDGTNFSSIVK